MKKKENIYFQIHQKYETDIKKDCKIITDRVRKIFPNSNYACLAPFANWHPKFFPNMVLARNFIKKNPYGAYSDFFEKTQNTKSAFFFV